MKNKIKALRGLGILPILLISILVLLLFGPLILSTPIVQNRIVNRITKNLSEKLEGDIQIEKLELKFNGNLNVKGLRVKDHQDNPLIEVNNIVTSVTEINKLLNADLNFNQLNFEGLNIEVNKYQNDSLNSLDIFINKLNNNDQSQREFRFQTQTILMNNAHFSYSDREKPKDNFSVDSIYMLIHQVDLQPKKIQAKITNVEWFSEWNGVNSKNSISGVLDLSDGNKLRVNGLSVVYNESRFTGEVSINELQGLFDKLGPEPELDIEFNNAVIYPGRLGLKDYFDSDFKLDLTAQVSGSLDQLKLENLMIRNQNFNLLGSFELNDLLKLKPTVVGEIEDLIFSKESLDGVNYSLPKEIQSLDIDSLELKGNLVYGKNLIELDLGGKSNLGGLAVNGNFGRGIIEKSSTNKSIDLTIDCQKFDVQKLLKTKGSLQISGKLGFSSTNAVINNKPSISWETKNLSALYRNQPIDSIISKGTFSQSQLNFGLEVNSKIIRLEGEYYLGLASGNKSIRINNDFEFQDLDNIFPKIQELNPFFSGKLITDLQGKNWDELLGYIQLNDLSITSSNQLIPLNNLVILSEKADQTQSIFISSEDRISGRIIGDYHYSELFDSTAHALSEALGIRSKKNIGKPQEFHFHFSLGKDILSSIYPRFFDSDDIEINGLVSTKNEIVQFDFKTNNMRYDKLNFKNLKLLIDYKDSIHHNKLEFSHFSRGNFRLTDILLEGNGPDGHVDYAFNFSGIKENRGELNFIQSRDNDENLYIDFKDSRLAYKGTDWKIQSSNNSHQRLIYNTSKRRISVESFLIEGPDKSISFSGGLSSFENEVAFKLEVINSTLENIIPPSKDFALRGNADILIDYSTSRLTNKLLARADIDGFVLNNQFLGTTTLRIEQSTVEDFFNVELSIENNGMTSLDTQGKLWLGESPSVEMELGLRNFDITFLNRIGDPSVDQIRGTISGEVMLEGPINRLQHNGSLQLSNGGIGIPFLNVDYSTDSVQVDLSNQAFIFRNSPFYDSTFGTSMYVEGRIFHNDFKNWQLDIDARSDRMLLVNKYDGDDAPFTGAGYLNGTAHIEGLTRSLYIEVSGQSQKGTSIRIPQLIDTSDTLDTSFISFVDKNSTEEESIARRITQPEIIKGVTLEFDLDITDDAEIEIVTDPQFGSYLSGSGTGSLQLDIDTNGKFNMLGDFVASEGLYNFKYLGLIDKDFELVQGSSIIWDGNPVDAQMSLKAVYRVPGGANPSVLLETPSFSKKIPTSVNIDIQGNLQRPNSPSFVIDFPNASGVVISEINYRLADPQNAQLQALSLLSQGIFIRDVSVSLSGITSNIFQAFSDVISDLLGRDEDKLKMGINYLQGDKSQILDFTTADRLGVSLTTQISDRILIEGNIGVPVGGIEQTYIIGDIQIDFILNQQGTLRARIFNKENELRYIGDELGYTQGIGLSYAVDFDTFGSLLKKIIKGEDIQ